ncbi:hypothetical protein ACFYQA_31630 [Streptomyces sp. NPDC005774]|uniref:hypothetical protein n=1 Tax=Streptomyces sp. NPDC005774 TaxID=3364728 RepID=UPI0036B1BC7B
MTTDLAALTTAADGWDGMAKELNKQEKAYKRDVHGISMGQTWLGLSADAANRRFDTTLTEYQNAQTEAKAIASLLLDAHTQFADLRGKLRAARQDAISDDMKVSEQGIVSYDTQRLSESTRTAYRHDPDFQESVRKSVRSWQDRIDQLVKDVTDADKGVEIAFNAVVVDTDLQDGTFNGFNGQAQGDIEKYEAENAEEIATRLADGKKVSAAELAELDRAFRDNSDNKVFSQTLLKGLGPEGTIRLTNELNQLAYDDDKKHKAQYLELQGGLADTVAKATQVPGSVTDAPLGSQKFKDWLAGDDGRFYRQWMDNLDKHGAKNYGSNSHPLYGYQSFVSLMQHSSVKYDDQFLYELGDDLIAAEKKQSNIFAQWGARHNGIYADALDGLLGIMSKNPDAATAFFDPSGNGSGSDHVGNSHLKYLLNEREWPQISTPTPTMVITVDDPFSRAGLGAALEAAATGQFPLQKGQDPWPEMPHSDAQARVMHGIIEELKPSEGTDAPVHENLRQPLANALAQYTNDTHEILGGMDANYVRAATGDGYFRDGDTTHLAVSQKDLVQVMRGLSEDPDAYATLHKAESRYIDAEMRSIPEGSTDFERSAPLSKAGATLGAYSAIREGVINDERMAGYSEADWKSKIAYHIIGGAVTPLAIPTAGGSIAIGDALQRGVDTWAWQWGNSMKAEADAPANAAIADEYLNANNQMATMVDAWASDRADLDTTTDKGKAQVAALTNDILNGHDRGSNTAQKYLTDTTN